MSSRRNKRRRQQKEWRDEHPPSETIREDTAPVVLRLVRPENESLSDESVSPGLADAPVDGVPDACGPSSDGSATTGADILVAATDARADDYIAAINPVPIEPGIYLVVFDGISKGPHLAAYRIMFTQTDCLGLLAKIPRDGETPALAVLLGWTKQFDLGGIGHWSICYNDWVRSTPSLKESGTKFIERLNSELLRHKVVEQIKPEPAHLLHLGAMAEMLFAGQLDKAVALYNGWARFADYGQIELKSHQPTILDIGNAMLQITGDTFKVIMVR